MNLFNKLHGRREPVGLEWRVLKKIPLITVVGSLIPLALSVLVRVLPAEPGIDMAKRIRSVDIFAIATEITLLTAALTVAIACFIIHVMKGPAYVADPYPLSHSDRPGPPPKDQNS